VQRAHWLAQVGSQDANDCLWPKLAVRVNALFAADDAGRIVITLGTDRRRRPDSFFT
jgi:hypothetical protein